MKQIPFLAMDDVKVGQDGKYPVVYGRGYGFSAMTGTCTLIPDCIRLMVKRVEILPEGRFAVTVKGAGLTRLKRGTTLVPLPFIPWFSGAIMIDTDRSCPRGPCRLVTPLTGGRRYGGRLDSFLGISRFTPFPGNGVPVAAGFQVSIEPDGREKTYHGTVLAAFPSRALMAGRGGKRAEAALEAGLRNDTESGSDRELEQETAIRIAYKIQGYVVLSQETGAADGIEKIEGETPPRIVPIESGTVCLASKRFLEDCGRFLAACSARPGGTELAAAASEAEIPPAVLAAVLPWTEQAGEIRLSQGRLLPAGDRVKRIVSPIGKGILEKLGRAGFEGISVSAFRNPPFNAEIMNLVRLGLVRKAGEFYWLPEHFVSAERAIDRMMSMEGDIGAGRIGEALGISKTRAQVLLREMRGKKGGFGE